MTAIVIIPIGIVFAVSLATRGSYGRFEWGLSTEAHVRILFEADWDGNMAMTPKFLAIIGHTLVLAALTTLICAAQALPAAYVIAQAGPR